MPDKTIRPLREGEVMGAYMEFDRTANRTWSSAQYLVHFGVYISERTAAVNAEEADAPHYACCGTTENLHADYGSGGPWRCDSDDCMVF